MSRAELLAELLAERFGVPATRERRAPSQPNPANYGGDADIDIVVAKRRRILCDALDERPAITVRRAA